MLILPLFYYTIYIPEYGTIGNEQSIHQRFRRRLRARKTRDTLGENEKLRYATRP
jgi:hypothetical protein